MLGNIFKAYDVRATYPDPLNEDAAWKVGFAAGQFLQQQVQVERGGRITVSRDMRPHSAALSHALSRGLQAAGAHVVDLGMADTSIQYFAVNHLGAIGGIQTTASHNPVNYNGFKISGQQARPIGATTGLTEIEQIARDLPDDTDRPAVGGYEQVDVWEDYRTHVLKFLAPLKRKLSVFVDASNGMAGKLVPRVFDGVENLEIIPLNFEITGEFAHEPNPLKAENMRWTQDGVREHGAALGACFDGDADRCMLVDDEGGIIGCDHLTALLAEHFAAIDAATPRPVDAPTTIVYDLRSSKVVPEMITALGARPQRSRVGHVFMKAKLRETKAIFGGELSGHFYFRDNHFADSGAIALASVLSVLGSREESLSQLVNPLRKYPQSGEINFRVEDKQAVMEGLKQTYSDAEEIDELDGITIDCFESRGWWFNVRPSNTEPLLRFNAEAKDETTLNRLIEEITPQLGEPEEDH